ncbi:hexosaminidase D-like isoform X2 [Xenia sp. Carnegie-2017]|nr:hexosaminidase D-like isoform X2 [Xenia sp. Carnegie-2017]
MQSKNKANIANAMKKQEFEKSPKKLTQMTSMSFPRMISGDKLVHLDLKGAAPKMLYIIKLLPTLKSLGATGLLVEYEDMFPYYDELSVLKSHNAYSLDEIKKFLIEIRNNGLLMIPLVQTFGHMEFVLKHKKFSHLRHVANMTTAVNPNHEGSFSLVKNIIDQIIKIHEGYIEYVHIGGDEVWSLKDCSSCEPSSKVYLKHMLPVIENVVSKKLTPIIWDDMMRRWSVENLKKIGSSGVQPMIWAYPPQLDTFFPEGMWRRYSRAFSSVWLASAFKGAETPSTNFVPISVRLQNHRSWMKIYSKLSRHIKINGIVLTGWSRFDHYASMCELLPAGLPSLGLCLTILKEGSLTNKSLWQVSTTLGFKSPIFLHSYDIPKDVSEKDEGTFLGHDIYGIVLKLRRAYNALESVEKRIPAWFNRRQFATSRISIYQLTVSFQKLKSATNRLTPLINLVREKFPKVYHDDTTEEWINDKIENVLTRAVEIEKYLNNIKSTVLKL